MRPGRLRTRDPPKRNPSASRNQRSKRHPTGGQRERYPVGSSRVDVPVAGQCRMSWNSGSASSIPHSRSRFHGDHGRPGDAYQLPSSQPRWRLRAHRGRLPDEGAVGIPCLVRSGESHPAGRRAGAMTLALRQTPHAPGHLTSCTSMADALTDGLEHQMSDDRRF